MEQHHRLPEQGAHLGAADVEGVGEPGDVPERHVRGGRHEAVAEARPVQDAAKFTRSMPDAFIAKNGHDVTKAFLDYTRPIVGQLPHSELL